MQHRHMRHGHPGGFRVFGKLIFIMLIIGALFATRSNSYRHGYWQGFTAGTLQREAPAAGSDTVAPVQPQTPDRMPDFGPRAGSPSLGLFLLLPLCAFGLFGLMGFMFMGSRMARRRRGWQHSKRPPWDSNGDDSDDEVGPEKDPNDYL